LITLLKTPFSASPHLHPLTPVKAAAATFVYASPGTLRLITASSVDCRHVPNACTSQDP